MTESKSNVFNAFSAPIQAPHHPFIPLLRDAFLAATEPNLDQRFANQFGFQMRAAEPQSAESTICNEGFDQFVAQSQLGSYL